MPRTNPDNINVRFCNIVLKSVQDDLTRRELADFRANAGVLENTCGGTNRTWLVEWPNMHGEVVPPMATPVREGVQRKGRTYAWQGEADNAADAKAKALNYWLEYHAPAVRARVQATGYMYSGEER